MDDGETSSPVISKLNQAQIRTYFIYLELLLN